MKHPNQHRHQRGFTLIELVVVIVILGILAVTAAPRFLNLKGDAVTANLTGLMGSIKSANNLVYSKSVVESQESLPVGEIDFNGQKVSTAYGYVSSTAENMVKALDGSFAVLINPMGQFDEDWGIFQMAESAGLWIVPKGYDVFGSNCNLHYNVNEPADGSGEYTIYSLNTSGC
ncbi:type II secretion system protein [Vibrio renipiscarius]|uniref:type II secretion system protein n=1 Tax=Vibrio renipiscarius TaxID=1461322 RepID=UPI00354EFF2C